MALGSIQGLDSTNVFKPQTMEEALVPFTKYQQEFEKQQAINDSVQEGIAKFAPYINKERDPQSWNLLQHINNQVDANAKYIGTDGFLLNLDNIRNMKYAYQNASNRFADQLQRKLADQEMAKKEMAQHPELQYQFHSNGNMYQLDDLSMDHYWDGARPTFYSVDADAVKKEGIANAQALIGRMGGHEFGKNWGQILDGKDEDGNLIVKHKTGGTSWKFKGIPTEVTPEMFYDPESHQEEWEAVVNGSHDNQYKDHLLKLRDVAGNASTYLKTILTRTNFDKMNQDQQRKLVDSVLLGMFQGLNNYSDSKVTNYDESEQVKSPGRSGGGGGGSSDVTNPLFVTRKLTSLGNGLDKNMLSFFGLDADNLNMDMSGDETPGKQNIYNINLRDKYGVYDMQRDKAENFRNVDKNVLDPNFVDQSGAERSSDYITMFDEKGNLLNDEDFKKANEERVKKWFDENGYQNIQKGDKEYGNFVSYSKPFGIILKDTGASSDDYTASKEEATPDYIMRLFKIQRDKYLDRLGLKGKKNITKSDVEEAIQNHYLDNAPRQADEVVLPFKNSDVVLKRFKDTTPGQRDGDERYWKFIDATKGPQNVKGSRKVSYKQNKELTEKITEEDLKDATASFAIANDIKEGFRVNITSKDGKKNWDVLMTPDMFGEEMKNAFDEASVIVDDYDKGIELNYKNIRTLYKQRKAIAKSGGDTSAIDENINYYIGKLKNGQIQRKLKIEELAQKCWDLSGQIQNTPSHN